MKKNINTLYAIYKNGFHLGNERATGFDDAIKKYLIAASYAALIDDKEFVSLFKAKIAIKGIHFS